MIEIRPLDNVWVRIDCEDGIARELSDYFTFEQPNARYMQRQAAYRRWDGRIRLFKLKTRTIYRGLLPRIIEFCEQRNYAYENHVPAPAEYSKALDPFLASIELPFQPLDYQRAALIDALDKHRNIILSPTGSGKSFIIYLLTEILQKRTLIVVPTIGLVSQLTADFKSYGADLSHIHQIKSGSAKDADARVYISTWQSIYELPESYFHQFGCVIVDEVHLAKAKSLTHLMEKTTKTRFRFGFTGTLDDTQAHRLILEGLFGEAIRVATTSDLQKKKRLAPLRVRMLVMQYPESVRKQLRRAQYQDEVEFIEEHPARTEIISQLVANRKGNTLVLFAKLEHGRRLYERIRAVAHTKTVHYIAGSVDGDERESIRKLVEQSDGEQVIVASYGTCSTGINITNLDAIVFAAPSKSKVRVLQSIGRALRTHENKSHATLIDVVDDLRCGAHVNYTMKHAEARALYYASEKFPVTMHPISLAAFTIQEPQDAQRTAVSDELPLQQGDVLDTPSNGS